MTLLRGQRLKLSDMGISDLEFSVSLEMARGSLTVDTACFGLAQTKKLLDERYMTFFNQPSSPCGAVHLVGPSQFNFNLSRLPATIESLIITLAIDGAGSMSQLGPCTARLLRGSNVVAIYPFEGEHFASERAVMLLEFYRKDGQWRACAAGQGFNGGLDALVTHFGGAVAEKPAPPPTRDSIPPEPRTALPQSTSKLLNDYEKYRSLTETQDWAGICNMNGVNIRSFKFGKMKELGHLFQQCQVGEVVFSFISGALDNPANDEYNDFGFWGNNWLVVLTDRRFLALKTSRRGDSVDVHSIPHTKVQSLRASQQSKKIVIDTGGFTTLVATNERELINLFGNLANEWIQVLEERSNLRLDPMS